MEETEYRAMAWPRVSLLFRHLIFALFLCPLLPLSAQSSSETARDALVKQGNPLFQGNDVTLLPSAREKYANMFSVIRKAKRFVHVEYFIFHNDSVGTELFDILAECAGRGVEVRVLIDAYGNYKSPSPLTSDDLAIIRQRGIKIEIFDRLRFPWLGNIMHRDHRKIVVVDGEKAYTGGMNVADYYLKGKKRTGKWRDMQARFEGPVVDEFERIFAHIWEKATGEQLDSLRYHTETEFAGQKEIIIVNREPHTMSRRMRRAYVASIDAAQEEIRIVNPYPTSVYSLSRAMKRALKRGVRLQLMVSSSSDNRIVPEVVGIQMKKLMKRGAEIYYYEGGFHHSKVMMVDNAFCTVGTTNLDARSLRCDYEVNAFVFDAATTYQLNEIFDADVQHSQLLTPENFKQRFSLKRRIVGRIFQPIKGFL